MDAEKIVNRVASRFMAGPDEKLMLQRVNNGMNFVQTALKRGDLAGALSSLKRVEGVLQELLDTRQSGVIKGPYADAIKAYGDGHGLAVRDLNWKSGWVGAREVVGMAKAAVPEGYGEFTWQRLAKAISVLPGTYVYQFGRENSPVVYVAGFKSLAEAYDLEKLFRLAKADEAGVQSGNDYFDGSRLMMLDGQSLDGFVFRAWWD